MSTPHIDARPGQIHPTVLLPGDPQRARYIAERFLDDAELVTSTRGMLGYSGTCDGEPISVLGSGMGIPSLSIYVQELARHYGVQRIIRLGSCGAIQRRIKLRDIVVAMGAATDSNVNRLRFGGYDMAPVADFGLLGGYVAAAQAEGQPLHVGAVFSSDLYYHPDADLGRRLLQFGVLAVEMEAAGLYGLAAELGVKALTVLTVSNHLMSGAELDSREREQGFDPMIRLALAAATGTDTTRMAEVG